MVIKKIFNKVKKLVDSFYESADNRPIKEFEQSSMVESVENTKTLYDPSVCIFYSKELFCEIVKKAENETPVSVKHVYDAIIKQTELFELAELTPVVIYNRVKQTLEVSSVERLQGIFMQ